MWRKEGDRLLVLNWEGRKIRDRELMGSGELCVLDRGKE